MTPTTRKTRYAITAAAIILLLTCIILILRRPSGRTSGQSESRESAGSANGGAQIPAPSEIIRLPDSTRIYVLEKVKLKHNAVPGHLFTVSMDGDMFFDRPDVPESITIRTRLLNLTVKGKAAFRVIAYSREDGEEVQVLYGNIIAKKAYQSDYPEPDTLRDNDLLMINRTIDLMEKEGNIDTKQLHEWKKQNCR